LGSLLAGLLADLLARLLLSIDFLALLRFRRRGRGRCQQREQDQGCA
jgi:hypothetical protein